MYWIMSENTVFMYAKREQICFLATALIKVRKSHSPICVKSVERCHHPASLSGPSEFLWKGWRRSVNILFISLTLHFRSPKTHPEAEPTQITFYRRYMTTTLKHNCILNICMIMSYPPTFCLCRVQKSPSKMLRSLPSALWQQGMFQGRSCHVLLLWIGQKIVVPDAAAASCRAQPCRRNMSQIATICRVVSC